jgi:hypothetical protein
LIEANLQNVTNKHKLEVGFFKTFFGVLYFCRVDEYLNCKETSQILNLMVEFATSREK